MKHLYFPISGIVSLLYVLKDGSSAEIAMTGNEGTVGVSMFLGGVSPATRGVVQCAGRAYRLRASLLKEEFALGGPLHHLLLTYTQSLINQMTQTAVCNRHHHLEQQFCRWLLLSLDRLASNEVPMTQQLIANMLGVRREGVTAAAARLKAAGSIAYRRGCITVLDRGSVERRSCECYIEVKKADERLLYPDVSHLLRATAA